MRRSSDRLVRPGASPRELVARLTRLILSLASWDETPGLGDARFLVLGLKAGEAPSFVQVLVDPTRHGLLVEVDSGFFEPAGAWRAAPEQRKRATGWGFSDGTSSNFAKAVFVGSVLDAERLARELVAVLGDLCGWSPGEAIDLVVEHGGRAQLHASLTAGDVEELLRRSGLGARIGESTTDDAPADDAVIVVRSAVQAVPFAVVLSDRVEGPRPRFRHLRFQARFAGAFPPAAAERFNAEAPAGRATRDGKALVVSLDVPLEGGVSEPALRAAVERFGILAHAGRLFAARCELRASRLGVLRRAHFKPPVQDLERRLLRLVRPARAEDIVQELAERRAEPGIQLAAAMSAEIRRIVDAHPDWTWIEDMKSPSGLGADELADLLRVLGSPELRRTSAGHLVIAHPGRDASVVVDPGQVRRVRFDAGRDRELYAIVQLATESGPRRFMVTPDDLGFEPLVGDDLVLLGAHVAVRPPGERVTTGEAFARLVSLEQQLPGASPERIRRGCADLFSCLLGARAAGLDLPWLERRLQAVLTSVRLRGGDPRGQH